MPHPKLRSGRSEASCSSPRRCRWGDGRGGGRVPGAALMRSLLQALQVGAEFAWREGPCVARFFMPSPPMIVAQRASDAAPPPPAASAAGALPPAPTTDLSTDLARVSAAVEAQVGVGGEEGVSLPGCAPRASRPPFLAVAAAASGCGRVRPLCQGRRQGRGSSSSSRPRCPPVAALPRVHPRRLRGHAPHAAAPRAPGGSTLRAGCTTARGRRGRSALVASGPSLRRPSTAAACPWRSR